MNYIVLDLEWNQSMEPEDSDKNIPFEIIEIGAVRLNDQFQIVDEFQCLIRPQIYVKLTGIMTEMMGFDETRLQNQETFDIWGKRFLEWCGAWGNYRFCTFGDSDLIQLQRNLDHYGLPKLEKPLKYYDIQKIYDKIKPVNNKASSLERVVEECQIPKKEGFHRALSDAHYTAKVIQMLDHKVFLKQSSYDLYNNPKNKNEEIHRIHEGYYEYISREFDSKTDAMADEEVMDQKCYVCGEETICKIDWFSSSQTVYYCLMKCQKHGYLWGKLKFKTTRDGKCFVIKTMIQADDKSVARLRGRYEEVKLKKAEKRKRLHK